MIPKKEQPLIESSSNQTKFSSYKSFHKINTSKDKIFGIWGTNLNATAAAGFAINEMYKGNYAGAALLGSAGLLNPALNIAIRYAVKDVPKPAKIISSPPDRPSFSQDPDSTNATETDDFNNLHYLRLGGLPY